MKILTPAFVMMRLMRSDLLATPIFNLESQFNLSSELSQFCVSQFKTLTLVCFLTAKEDKIQHPNKNRSLTIPKTNKWKNVFKPASALR